MTRLRIIAEFEITRAADLDKDTRRIFDEAVGRVFGHAQFAIPGTLVYLATEQVAEPPIYVEDGNGHDTVCFGRDRTEFEP